MMRTMVRAGLIATGAALLLVACQDAADEAGAPAARTGKSAWPSDLVVVGDGFPESGDPCRIIGESAATVDYLDHTATLAGCLSTEEAAALGGRVVDTVAGVTLVSVPTPARRPGAGDGQGDARVTGTDYHATAQVRCSGYQGAAAGMCDAGVVRGTGTGTHVEVTLPDGRTRTIFFNMDGSFLSFPTAQADGTAAMKIGSSREGDTTIARLGTERYEIPDVLVKGD